LNVPEWLQPHDEQALDIAQMLRTPAVPLLKQKLAVEDPNLLNPIAARDIVENICFVISMQSLTHCGVVSLADIKQPVKIEMKVRIEGKAIRPEGMWIIIEERPIHFNPHTLFQWQALSNDRNFNVRSVLPPPRPPLALSQRQEKPRTAEQLCMRTQEGDPEEDLIN